MIRVRKIAHASYEMPDAAIIIAHLVVNYFHGAAHVTLAIGLVDWEREFLAIVILLAPILAGVMLLSRLRRAGGWLLAASMAGACVFGVYKHFIGAGPDNALTMARRAFFAVSGDRGFAGDIWSSRELGGDSRGGRGILRNCAGLRNEIERRNSLPQRRGSCEETLCIFVL